jgi:hypothetical protein
MKTPQEAAREYAETLWSRESTLEWEVSRDACKTRSERDFLAGDAFGYRRGMEKAYRWISVGDELPKDQDDVLVLFCNGRKGIGSYVGSNEWAVVIANEYDSHDLKVLAWRPIERVKEQ